MLLGAHTSTAGGVSTAIPRAKAIGATAMQIFTKGCSQWKEPAITDEERGAFGTAVSKAGFGFVCAHDSYLINLATPDPVLWTRSLISFTSELRRCEALGLDALVSHPGNYMDDRANGIARNAAAITIALETVPGRVRLLLELTAGSGTALGSSFDELALIVGALPRELQHRVGVCVDTAHAFASGYDLRNPARDTWRELDDALGLERLGALHLNDSKAPLGSRRDRHELIGRGMIGADAFRRIMTDQRLAHVPRIIETPKGDDEVTNDRRMLQMLRRFAAG